MIQLVKEVCDRILALILFFFLLPVFFLVGLLIVLSMGNPILFIQPRPGKNGQVFQFYKFRTMSNAKDDNGSLMSDAQRLTTVGSFLRKTSLDELPQLWNVLKGDMSFVGPRPLLIEYLERYTTEQSKRHKVKPGITGWAQVNGRNSISWEDKFSLDVWYVEHQSFFLDLRILLLTVIKVFKREGISQANHATMEKFQGVSQSNQYID